MDYLLSKEDLNAGVIDGDKSSLKSLINRSLKKYSAKEIVIGNRSLGHLLEMEGYQALPSPRKPAPGNLLILRHYCTAVVHR